MHITKTLLIAVLPQVLSLPLDARQTRFTGASGLFSGLSGGASSNPIDGLVGTVEEGVSGNAGADLSGGTAGLVGSIEQAVSGATGVLGTGGPNIIPRSHRDTTNPLLAVRDSVAKYTRQDDSLGGLSGLLDPTTLLALLGGIPGISDIAALLGPLLPGLGGSSTGSS